MSKRIAVRCVCGAVHHTGQGCKVGKLATAIQQSSKDHARESREAVQSRRDAGEVRVARESAATVARIAMGKRASPISRKDNAYKIPGARELDPQVVSTAPTKADVEQRAKEAELIGKWYAMPKETLTRDFCGKVR